MRPARIAVAILLSLAAGCSIEPTPREYIDRPRTAEPQALAREVIDDHLRIVVQSLAAGDPASARRALAPSPEVRVYGPGGEDRFEGAPQIDALLELVAQGAQNRLRLRELNVDAEPRGMVAWFAVALELSGPEGEAAPVRVTGVYRQREAAWELVQAHVWTGAHPATATYPAGSPAPAEGGSP